MEEALIVCAMMSSESVWFVRSRGTREGKVERDEEALERHAELMDQDSDHRTLLKLYREWEYQGRDLAWLKENFLRVRAFTLAWKIFQQLQHEVKKVGIELSSSGNRWDPVMKSLCTGFSLNAAQLCKQGIYRVLPRPGNLNHDSILAFLDPSSGLLRGAHGHHSSTTMVSQPPFVIFHELIRTARPFLRTCSAVDDRWLHQCRQLLQKDVSLEELCGKPRPKAAMEASSQDSEDAPKTLRKSTADKSEEISAAKARYLARRNQK